MPKTRFTLLPAVFGMWTKMHRCSWLIMWRRARRGLARRQIDAAAYGRVARYFSSSRATLLAVVERAIERVGRVKVGVRAGGDERAAVEDEDFRRVADRREAVRDDQHGLADHELLQRGL